MASFSGTVRQRKRLWRNHRWMSPAELVDQFATVCRPPVRDVMHHDAPVAALRVATMLGDRYLSCHTGARNPAAQWCEIADDQACGVGYVHRLAGQLCMLELGSTVP